MATLKYDDIKLNGKVNLPRGYQHLGTGLITCIDNTAILDGINEPIFSCIAEDVRFNFGLKYILKNYIK